MINLMPRKNLFSLLLLLIALKTHATDTLHLPTRHWAFAIDPLKVGDNEGWYRDDLRKTTFDYVDLPHCYSVDPRYFFFNGQAWYKKEMEMAAIPENRRLFLHFEAVYYKCSIYLNNELVGNHEGGYTPFEVELTGKLKAGKNTLAIKVDNNWDTTTIPAARPAREAGDPINSQLIPWMNYGGITRDCWLLSRTSTFIERVKVETDPDLQKGTATVSLRATLNGTASASVQYTLLDPQGKVLRTKWTANNGIAYTKISNAQLWDQDHPFLYRVQCVAGGDTLLQTFAVRKVEVKGTQLLLNGHPIKMGGANRPLDYPGLGSMEPDSVVEKDMRLMKEAGMEFSRFCHYPVSERTLNWMDAHGMLIIEEAGNWQLAPSQMASPRMRELFRQQFREMIQRDWNHPSIIAWSVGNEFQSFRPEGIQWVKDMKAYANELDNSRLVTFASCFVHNPGLVKKPEDEASNYVDFVSANMYGNYENAIKHIHEIYPNKPLFVSEFGQRADFVKSEDERIAHCKTAIDAFRKADYVIGACLWTYNDYLSRYPNTNPNGYRQWGAVDQYRNPRALYNYLQSEFSPLLITSATWQQEQLVVKVSARADFPVYPTDGYLLEYNGVQARIPALQPGGQTTVTLQTKASADAVLTMMRPGGFVIHRQKIQ